MTPALKQQAIDFLKQEFHPDLPYDLHFEGQFLSHPIKGPLLAELYSFVADSDRYFVFAGETIPMIYPQMDLTVEELWAVQIGTEYFLEQGVKEDTGRNPHYLLTYLKMVATVFQEQLYIAKTDQMKVLKVYQLNEQKHVVGNATFNDKVYSWIVGDIPHFVYKKELPPQIIWSLHMGRILLN